MTATMGLVVLGACSQGGTRAQARDDTPPTGGMLGGLAGALKADGGMAPVKARAAVSAVRVVMADGGAGPESVELTLQTGVSKGVHLALLAMDADGGRAEAGSISACMDGAVPAGGVVVIPVDRTLDLPTRDRLGNATLVVTRLVDADGCLRPTLRVEMLSYPR